MLNRINYFILSVIFFELVSFFAGFGTHFEHYKYAVMLSIIVLNYIVYSRNRNLEMVKQPINSNKRS
jgi:hypothetical protein